MNNGGAPDELLWFWIWHLLKVLEKKDEHTFKHCKNTAHYSKAFAKVLKLSNEEINDLHMGGCLHDIGKIFLPSDILQKPSKLTADEYTLVKKHVLNGLNIAGDYDLPITVINCIKYHHERWDGLGYPFELTGNLVPLEGRILQITDAFSAMTIKRVYRENLSLDDSLAELEKNCGTQFDSELTDIFIRNIKEGKLIEYLK